MLTFAKYIQGLSTWFAQPIRRWVNQNAWLTTPTLALIIKFKKFFSINNFIEMIDIPIRKKLRNYPKDFTPPPGFLQPDTKPNYAQSEPVAGKILFLQNHRNSHLKIPTDLQNNPSQSGEITEEGLKFKRFSGNINPEDLGTNDQDKEVPIINQHIRRRKPYINPDLLLRPRIQQNGDKDLIQRDQQQQIQNSPGCIKKNIFQKPLKEQQPNFIQIVPKQVSTERKIQQNEQIMNQAIKSYTSFSNQKEQKLASVFRKGSFQPESSVRLAKRQSDTQVYESYLQTPKQRSEEKKKIYSISSLLDEKKIDQIKNHINQMAVHRSKNRQRMFQNQTNYEEQKMSFSQMNKKSTANFKHPKRNIRAELASTHIIRPPTYDDLQQEEQTYQNQARRIQQNSSSKYEKGDRKIVISYKKTSLNQLKTILKHVAESEAAHIDVVVPNIFMNIYFNPNLDKNQLYSQASQLFDALGIKVQNFSVKRYSNCILMVSRNICILWHYNGRIYLGGWQVKYLDEGVKHGLGLQWVPGKYAYYGQFIDSRKQGIGIMKSNSEVYIGEWLNNKRTNNGYLIKKNGSIQKNSVNMSTGYKNLHLNNEEEVDPFS